MIASAFTLFTSLFLTLFIGVPIAFCLLISSYTALALFEPRTNLVVLMQRMFVGADNYVFMAVPFFMLAGELMLKGGISKRLVDFAKVTFWWMPATLANVTTAAIAAASGTLGVIIPPSIPMVIYGITASVSVPKLFIGGIIPGLVLALIICCVNVFISGKHAKPVAEVRREMIAGGVGFWNTFKRAVWALMMPVIILGGIYGGLFTPTEAAVVSAFYAAIVGAFVYRELKWSDMGDVFGKAALSTGMILLVIAACSPFAWFMTSKGIPGAISAWVLSALESKFLLILAMNIILLFLGCFLDTGVIILLVTPIFLPIAASTGISPVALGLIMVMNTSIGMITPPMAVNLYIATRISGCTIEQISKKVVPFLAAESIFVIIVSNFTSLLDWLPNLIG